jgi:hypothetical protein
MKIKKIQVHVIRILFTSQVISYVKWMCKNILTLKYRKDTDDEITNFSSNLR